LDDDHIAFFQTSQNLDIGQIFVLNVKELDAEPYQLTDFPVEISNIKFQTETKLLAFSAAVYSDGSLEGTRERDDQIQKSKRDTALVFDSLMVRHWDEFSSEKKNNIFLVKLELHNGKYRLEGSPKNLMKGSKLVTILTRHSLVSVTNWCLINCFYRSHLCYPLEMPLISICLLTVSSKS
jgi:dipeptidyl aminopeptidase/acylaminoacyl peptidase